MDGELEMSLVAELGAGPNIAGVLGAPHSAAVKSRP